MTTPLSFMAPFQITQPALDVDLSELATEEISASAFDLSLLTTEDLTALNAAEIPLIEVTVADIPAHVMSKMCVINGWSQERILEEALKHSWDE